MGFDIRQGDNRVLLCDLDDRSVQCVVTSPPYFGLRDYGMADQIGLESTPDAYVQQLVAVFREVRRVLKDDGVLWLNLGDSYASGGRKTRDPGQSKLHRAFEGDAYRDGLRPEDPEGIKPKDLIGISWRVAFALQADGWYLRSDIIWHKPNPMPESVTDRPTKSHEHLFLMAKSKNYYYDHEAIKEPATGEGPGNKRPTKAARSGSDSHRTTSGLHLIGARETRNKRDVWTIPTQPFRGAHFATMPEALIEPCILAGSRPGDTVLDPFSGSGRVGLVAIAHKREYLGLELNPDYCLLSIDALAARAAASAA